MYMNMNEINLLLEKRQALQEELNAALQPALELKPHIELVIQALLIAYDRYANKLETTWSYFPINSDDRDEFKDVDYNLGQCLENLLSAIEAQKQPQLSAQGVCVTHTSDFLDQNETTGYCTIYNGFMDLIRLMESKFKDQAITLASSISYKLEKSELDMKLEENLRLIAGIGLLIGTDNTAASDIFSTIKSCTDWGKVERLIADINQITEELPKSLPPSITGCNRLQTEAREILGRLRIKQRTEGRTPGGSE